MDIKPIFSQLLMKKPPPPRLWKPAWLRGMLSFGALPGRFQKSWSHEGRLTCVFSVAGNRARLWQLCCLYWRLQAQRCGPDLALPVSYQGCLLLAGARVAAGLWLRPARPTCPNVSVCQDQRTENSFFLCNPSPWSAFWSPWHQRKCTAADENRTVQSDNAAPSTSCPCHGSGMVRVSSQFYSAVLIKWRKSLKCFTNGQEGISSQNMARNE